MLNEEKRGERRSLTELMDKNAALDEQLSQRLKEALDGLQRGADRWGAQRAA